MKNFITAIFIVFSVFLYSQGECRLCPPVIEYTLEINDTLSTTFNASRLLKDDLDDFFKHAKENDVDLIRFCKFKGIFLNSHETQFPKSTNTYGFTYFYGTPQVAFISINSDLIPDYLPSFKNAVLYHEMFHFILDKTDHTFGVSEPYVTRSGYYINAENLIKIWDESEKKEYFNFIKREQNSVLLPVFTLEKANQADDQTYEMVTATVYNAVPEQTNSDPEHTAFMFRLDLNNPYKHRIVALSRDLLKKFPAGTKVKISGTSYDGIWVVNDKMNKRYTKRIDLLINTNMKIGKWKNVRIQKVQ